MPNLVLRSLVAIFGAQAQVMATPVRRASTISSADIVSAFNQLQTWYNEDNGLWIPSTGWWNSANCMTVVADAAIANVDGFQANATKVFANTYVKAQEYNGGVLASKAVDSDFLMTAAYTRQKLAKRNNGFLNAYYDDEGWWALGWIAAYDATNTAEYLSEAEIIFANMNASFGQTSCSHNSGGVGGIWWDKSHTYVNAIANELFLAVAARLAARTTGATAAGYLAVAKQQWAWFQGSGMINSGNTINDGLNQTTCLNNDGTVWSYNQGVILGGLAELSQLTSDESYLSTAQTIADAAISALAPNGILHEACEPSCGGDGSQFKGIFARNVQYLYQASPQSRYSQFLENNAESILANDAQGHAYSLDWAGPFIAPANASTQSSAMDAMVGAFAT